MGIKNGSLRSDPRSTRTKRAGGLWCKPSGAGEAEALPRFVFAGRYFDDEFVWLCVRWYLSFKLRYPYFVSRISERGNAMAHTMILRWVPHHTPDFEKPRNRYPGPVGGPWRMDKTYLKGRGASVHFYRMVDAADKTADLLLSLQVVEPGRTFQRNQSASAQIDEGTPGTDQYDDGPVGGLPLGGG